jgi:hypothetical protein
MLIHFVNETLIVDTVIALVVSATLRTAGVKKAAAMATGDTCPSGC